MTLRGRNIARRIVRRIGHVTDRVSRMRYFRGHGVHSPFVYSIVRNVLMAHRLNNGDTALYDALVAKGVSGKRAVQLQNLFSHCGYSSFGVDCAVSADMLVLTSRYNSEDITGAAAAAEKTGTTLIIMSCNVSDRRDVCRSVVSAHNSTTVDNRAYLVVFNNHLPKQHFRI